MTAHENKRDALRQILRQAYRGKDKIEVGDHWQDEVMRRIRKLGAIEPAPSFLDMLEQLVWKFAPVACLLILVLTALLFQFDFNSEYDIFYLFTNGTDEVTFTQFLEL